MRELAPIAVSEAKEKKIELQDAIHKLILNYQAQTGVFVQGIELVEVAKKHGHSISRVKVYTTL